MAQSILIVTDDPKLRASVGAKLEGAGFEIHDAGEAWQALDILEHRDPDLTLLDLDIPGHAGMDLLHAMKAKRPATALIAVSGRTDIGCPI